MARGIRWLAFLACLTALFVPARVLWAGSQTATLTGTVYDPEGNGLPGVKVHLTNPLTGFAQTQITGSDGGFTFNNLEAANTEEEYYLVSADKEGWVNPSGPEPLKVRIAVGDVKCVCPPIALKTAALPPPPPPPTPPKGPEEVKPPGQEVKPTPPPAPPPPATRPPAMTHGAAALLTIRPEDVTNTLGGVVDSRAVHTLPLADRDFIDLALLTPGSYPVEQGSVLEGASLVVNGTRANMNNFLLDGADDNDYTINQSLPFQIVEAMQEFRVQTSTSPAEFGRSGGAQINTISRRGLNTVHGGLFEFHRNSDLSPDGFLSVYNGGGFDQSASFFSGFYGADALSDPTLAKLYDRRDPQVVQNQFGANVGGAIKKNKLFGFFNWESFRVSNPRPIFEGVPENRLRSPSDCATQFGFTCNPVGLALFNLYPMSDVPNTTVSSFFGPFSVSDQEVGPTFFVGESANRSASDNFLGRIDLRKSDRASMSFKHNIQRIEQVQGGTVPRTAGYPGNGTEVNGRNQNFSYNYIQQFTHVSNELRLGWSRFRLNTLAVDRGLDPSSSPYNLQHLNFTNKGLPNFSVGASLYSIFDNFPSLGSGLGAPNARANNVWSLSDSLSLIRGRHNWKLGGEVRYTRLNVLNQAFGRGSLLSEFPFEPVFGVTDFASIARVGSDFGGGFDRYFRTRSFAWFVQDQWRRSNFTLNYGVRHEVNTAPVELRDRLVNYYPALGGLVRSGKTDVLDPFGNPVLDSSFNPVKAPHAASRAGFETGMNNFGPRFGFAWDPRRNNKTVVRGGYALVFDQQPLEASVNMLLNPPS